MTVSIIFATDIAFFFFKTYQNLDLEEFQTTFSAYTKPVIEEAEEDQKNTNKSKSQVLTVIDGRRSQNCTILLSKLKLTNEELAKAVMNVDEGEDLPKDMVEQVAQLRVGLFMIYSSITIKVFAVLLT